MKLIVANDEEFAPSEVRVQRDVRRGEPGAARPSDEGESKRQWWLSGTDAGRRALAIAAVAVPALDKRWRDAAAAAGSLLVAHQLCSLAKHIGSEERPDGSDDQSFPSSHAIETFSAAASLADSSGISLGVPAYAAAAWVGYGRIKARRHHVQDVVVGAIAGSSAAWLTSRALSAASRALGRSRAPS